MTYVKQHLPYRDDLVFTRDEVPLSLYESTALL